MEVLRFRAKGWHSGPVMTANTFFERWRGLRGAAPDASLLIRTNSVHGVGMDRPFQAIGLSEDYQVMESRVVAPGGFARFRSCKWVLETPADAYPPAPGQTLELVDV